MGAHDVSLMLLHGAGERASAWDGVIAELPQQWSITAVELAEVGMTGDGRFDLPLTARRLLSGLPDTSATVVCGLSLGAMIATQMAAVDEVGAVDAVVLSGGQVKAPRWMMRLQWHISKRLVPDRAFTGSGSTKPETLAMYQAAEDADFTRILGDITMPTAVWCGSRDVANRTAARDLAAGIPAAELNLVPGMGHGWHRSHPAAFAAHLREFIRTSGVGLRAP